MYYPDGMKARLSHVQSIEPHRISTRTWTRDLRVTIQSNNHYSTAALLLLRRLRRCRRRRRHCTLVYMTPSFQEWCLRRHNFLVFSGKSSEFVGFIIYALRKKYTTAVAIAALPMLLLHCCCCCCCCLCCCCCCCCCCSYRCYCPLLLLLPWLMWLFFSDAAAILQLYSADAVFPDAVISLVCGAAILRRLHVPLGDCLQSRHKKILMPSVICNFLFAQLSHLFTVFCCRAAAVPNEFRRRASFHGPARLGVNNRTAGVSHRSTSPV